MATYTTLGINQGGTLGDQDIVVTAGAAPGTRDLEVQFNTDRRMSTVDRYQLLTILLGYLQRHPTTLD